MRTGAIFARGSCRALKWLALLSVVFTLGVVDAAAQLTPDTTFDGDGVKVTVPESVTEGNVAEIVVELRADVSAGQDGGDVTVLATASDKGIDGATNELEDIASPETTTVTFPDNSSGTEVMEDVVRFARITLRAGDDDDEAEDEVVAVTIALSGFGGTTADDQGVQTFTIEDDETQEIELTEDDEGEATESADPIALTLKPKYAPVDDTITVVMTHNGGSDFELSPSSAQTFSSTARGPYSVTLTGPENDGDRETTTVTVSLTPDDPSVTAEPLPVEIADAHMLPDVMVKVTETDADADAATTLQEGKDYTLTVMLVDEEGEAASTDAEDLEVMLSLGAGSADESDYRLQPSSMVTIAKGGSSGELTLLVLEDSDINPERLVLNAQVSGDSDYGPADSPIPGVVNLPIGDGTIPTVTPKSQTEIDKAYMDARALVDDSSNMWRPGGRPLTIALNRLFNLPATGYDADADSDDKAVVTADADADAGATGGGLVTVTPVGEGIANVHVTVSTGTASATIQLSATSARATFKVMVDPAPAPDVKRGQLTEFKLIGSDVSEKTIAGTTRYHVPEGAQNVQLSVTVQWTHEEIANIGYERTQDVYVVIRQDRSTTGPSPAGASNWLSWIDDEGDVHFPRASRNDAGDGNLGGWLTLRTPRERDIPAAQRGSARHVKSATATLDVLVLHDNHEAENDAFYIEAVDNRWVDVDLNATRAVNAVTPEVVIEDDEDQTVTVKMGTRTSSTVYEGDSGDDVPEFTVAADPRRYDLPLEVRLDMVDLGGTTVSSGEISVSTGSLTLNDGSTGNSDTVTVHLPASDGNRVDDDYELQASVNVYSVSSGGYQTIEAASHPIKVIDRHKLPTIMVSPATGTVEEGGTLELTLTINRNPSNTPVSSDEKLQYTQEEVSVMLDMGAGSTAGAADFSVMTNPVVFPKRERGAYTAEKTVEVMATADDELDDMEILVLDAMVAGAEATNGSEKDSHAGVSTLTIEEGTAKLVWAKTQDEVEAAVYAAKTAGAGDDMMFTPGEMIELMGSALFNAAEGVALSYSAMTSDGDVASTSVDNAGMAMVTAMGAGMADITITAHASMPSGVKIADQTDPRKASITFPVEVGLEALTLMLTGPEDMNVVEGGVGAMVTATANRAVTEDVTINLMRDRAMSTAVDADFTAEAITIAAGMMTGTTTVMAVEDDMMESVDNMPEELVLYGMAEGMAGEVTGEVKLYLWDAAVPALPVIAQLLLAALMAVGGYRRYRRR